MLRLRAAGADGSAAIEALAVLVDGLFGEPE
jgi:hypothetical protein